MADPVHSSTVCPAQREEMCAYECMTELRISPKFSNLSRANKYKSSRCSLGEKATVHNGHLEPWKEKLGRKSSGSALYLTRPVNSTTNWEVRKAILHNDHPKQRYLLCCELKSWGSEVLTLPPFNLEDLTKLDTTIFCQFWHDCKGSDGAYNHTSWTATFEWKGCRRWSFRPPWLYWLASRSYTTYYYYILSTSECLCVDTQCIDKKSLTQKKGDWPHSSQEPFVGSL